MIKEKVNGNTRKAAKTMSMIDYAKSHDCILRIRPLQNECQQSVNNFRSGMSGNSKLIWSWLYRIEVLAVFISKTASDPVTALF